MVGASHNQRREKFNKYRAPQRTHAHTPAGPMPDAPQGPKLSDFWKPKSSPDRRKGRKDDVTSVPGVGAYMGPGGVPATTGMMGHQPAHMPRNIPTSHGGQMAPPVAQPPSIPPQQPIGPRAHMPRHQHAIAVPPSGLQNPPVLPHGNQPHSVMAHSQHQLQQIPPASGVPGMPYSLSQQSSLPPTAVSTAPPGSMIQPRPTPYGSSLPVQYGHGSVPLQGFPDMAQMPPVVPNSAISSGEPSKMMQAPGVSQAGAAMFSHGHQQPISHQQQTVSQQQPPMPQQIYQQPVSQQQQPVSQQPPTMPQQTYAQHQHPVGQQHQSVSQQPPTMPQQMYTQHQQQQPVSQQQIVNQHQTFNQQLNRQPPVSQQNQTVSQPLQPVNQPLQPVSQHQTYSPQHQPLTQRQPQMGTQQPVYHQQQPASQQQPLSNHQSFPQHQQPATQQHSPGQKPRYGNQQFVDQLQALSPAKPVDQQQQQTNQQFYQHPPTHPFPTNQQIPPQSIAAVPPSMPNSSQANYTPQNQTFPPVSAPGSNQQIRGPRPHAYTTGAHSGPGPNQQPSKSSNVGQRFGSPVHHQQTPHSSQPAFQQPQFSQPGPSQFRPSQPNPAQSIPISSYQPYQQYQPTHQPPSQGIPAGYQSPEKGPHQQGPQQISRYPVPSSTGPTTNQMGQTGQYSSIQPFPPSQSSNPVTNVNMRLKAEQNRLPEPTLQPTKLKKDLLSSSPEGESPLRQSEVMVPQNIKPEQARDSKPAEAQPISAAGTTMATDSNLAILSQPVLTNSDPTVGTNTIAPNSNLAILSDPVLSSHPKTQAYGSLSKSVVVTASQKEGYSESDDPYLDKAVLDRFVDEVDRLEKYVEGLNRQMLSGPTVLAGVWKEVNDDQDKETRQFSISVARCYPTKNRHPDVMPYDHNRVVLKTSSDDFINSSYIRDLSPATPTFIATQAPLPATMETFWQMIYEQQVFLLVMLVSSKSKGTSEFHQYWPSERGQSQRYGAFSVTLQSSKNSEFHLERFLQLTHVPTKQVRTVLHMQFTAWPEFGVPEKASDLLQFVSQIHNYHLQQKRLTLPIVVHCSGGIGRTGTFCTIYSAVQDINCGKGITDIPQVVKNLRMQRKWMVSEKELLKFCYEAVLCYAQQVLAKRGIFTKMAGTMSPRPSKNAPSRLNSFDVIMGANSVQSLQHSISKLSVRPPDIQGMTSDTPLCPMESTIDEAQEASDSNVMENIPSQPLDDSSPISSHPTEGANITSSVSESETLTSKNSGVSIADPEFTPKSTYVTQLLESNLDDFSQKGFLPPDVVESSTIPQGSHQSYEGSDGGSDLQGVLPSILEDLSPQNFSIKEEEKAKAKKFTKEDFEKRKNNLGAPQGDNDDPFNSLDPLWSMKGGTPTGK